MAAKERENLDLILLKYYGGNALNNIKAERPEKIRQSELKKKRHGKPRHIGETKISREGLKTTLTTFRSYYNVTVEFEDGATISRQKYEDFKKGLVEYPGTRSEKQALQRLWTTAKQHSGQDATIIFYKDYQNINVRFETGAVVKKRSYRSFINGEIRHPFPYDFEDCKLLSVAYNYGGECNYQYVCCKCGKVDIGTLNEIKNHICDENDLLLKGEMNE